MTTAPSWTPLGDLTGPQGPRGPIGADGPQGPKGDKGVPGDSIVGPAGPPGQRGLVGAKGDKGDTGQTGAKGETGATGDPGPKGDKGDTGDTTPSDAPGYTWSGAVTPNAMPGPDTRIRLLAGNTTLAAPGAGTTGKAYTVTLVLVQASGGPYTLTWPAVTVLPWADGAPAPTMPTVPNARMYVHLFWDGQVWTAFYAGVRYP